MSKISDEEKNGAGVKQLGEWRRGYCDERVNIQQASFGGLYQVRVLDDVVWLDWPNRTAQEFATVDLAKAAAQADYEQRILSALTNTDLSLRAENERLKAQVGALMTERTSLIETKREQLALMQVDVTRAEWRAVKAEAKLEEAAKVLEPFAAYEVNSIAAVGEPIVFFRVNVEKSEPKLSDFRAAKSFLANLKGAE